ncbi:arylamine N-acetyltransferase [Fibrisoma montanum]|uniref:Arylamine N-acetyltransferase n=1 Tax=Fibrisoma montanum TaxID=2305895 RepID=A0A418LXV6_9BACT|nr:arylamine N-acetyltransferase [Fibrisoma montanum]RIV18153.1 arylamine N-acetyltransferase [Fibrisoma montanum]
MNTSPAEATTLAVPASADVPTINLDAYFERIGYAGDRMPTLDTLAAILFLHPQVIPFENVNPLLRLPVRLDLESLQQKLVYGGRGGYCFEQNTLLSHVLQAVGFSVKGLAARVVWNVAEGVVNPRTHMLLLVDVAGEPYIADVGFGGMTLTAPLRLEPDVEQPTPHEPFRLRLENDEYVLQANIRDEWKSLYRFTLQEQLLPDYELASWYLCSHPSSHFLKGFIAARTTPDRRYALRGNELAVHSVGGDTERTVIADADTLRQTLTDTFRIRLPDDPTLDDSLQQAVRPTM